MSDPLTCVYFLGGPIPATLHDAKRGVAYSALAIYAYFCAELRRGSVPARDVVAFVAAEIDKVLDEAQMPDEMFRRAGWRVTPTLDIYDQVLWLNQSMPLEDNDQRKGAFSVVGERIHKSPSQVKDLYYRHDHRVKRLAAVQRLLDEFTRGDPERMAAIRAELDALYDPVPAY